jgi:hypothetical protein
MYTVIRYARHFYTNTSITMNEHTISYITISPSKRTSLVLIIVFISIIIFDSTIVKFSSYSGVNLSDKTNITIFIIFSVIFGTSSIALISSVRKMRVVSKHEYESTTHGLVYFHRTIIITQILTFAIMLIIIFQMLTLDKYSITFLKAQVYLSHISGLIFLASLAYLFAGWMLKSKRNYAIILYIVAFSLASANLIVSLLYLQSYFSLYGLRDVYPYSINAYVTNQPGIPFAESLVRVFDALSLSSFLLMWIATAIILSQYRHKMGRIKYYSLMSVPLIYYIFPLQGYFGDVFFNLLQSSPISYSILYILIFSATKQVGAVLFSLAFWTASTLVYENRIRKSLLVSAIGMAILFGTFEISPLQYHTYPAYGFITQAFIPLGAYLLFVGVFTSAKVIARDAAVRKELYKSASSQLSLLKNIGVSQMEKELEKQLKSVEEKVISSERTDDIPQLEKENVKQILHELLNELYYSKDKK